MVELLKNNGLKINLFIVTFFIIYIKNIKIQYLMFSWCIQVNKFNVCIIYYNKSFNNCFVYTNVCSKNYIYIFRLSLHNINHIIILR